MTIFYDLTFKESTSRVIEDIIVKRMQLDCNTEMKLCKQTCLIGVNVMQMPQILPATY